MEKLRFNPPRSASPTSRSDSNAALATVRQAGLLPPVRDQYADVEIPRAVWSAWKEDGKPRYLRRVLKSDERDALQRRANELKAWVGGFHKTEMDMVALAITRMFNAFPAYAMKSGPGVVAQVKAVMEALEPYPAWAIVKACQRIGTEGFVRKEGVGEYRTEKHWPPSIPELIDEVRQAAAMLTTQYKNAIELLEAEVEE